MNINEIIARYLKNVKLFKSNNTFLDEEKNCYFFKVFFEMNNYEEVDYDVFIDYIIYLRDKFNNSNYTIKKKLNTINRALEFNKIDKIKIDKLSYQKKEPSIFTIDDLKLLKNAMINHPRFNDEYLNLLDLTILSFVIDTGCRITESSNLEFNNIDFFNNSCTIFQTKNYKNKTVYFTDSTKKYILELSSLNNSKYVFLNKHTNLPITRFYFYDVCRHLEKITNLKVNPHKFRHTFASLMIENGCPIESVQKLLGHSDIKTTMFYIHLNKSKIKNDYIKYWS